MASFLAELGRDRSKKRKKISLRYHFCPNRVGAFLKYKNNKNKIKKNHKEIKKKKKKNFILASFLVESGRNRVKKRKIIRYGIISARTKLEHC